jgi:hypothetical protein
MTPSELVALGKALEEMERPRAAERQGEGRALGAQTLAAHANSKTRDESGYTREVVGSALNPRTTR